MVMPLHDGVLVGRSAERATLDAAVHASARGEGRVIALVGEAGIGKSRLCREAEVEGRRLGMPVLVGRAVESGPDEPFRPLIEALATGFRETGPPEDPSLLPFRGTLAHLLPSWARAPTPAPSVVALAEAVLRLLSAAAADRGAMLVLEDLHWADDDVLAIVEYLADNAAAHGCCCLVTLRPDVDGPRDIVRRLTDRRSATTLELGPLADVDVDELVRHVLAADALPAELLTYVRDRADGIPFFVEELLAGLVRSGALVTGPHGWHLVASRLSPAGTSLRGSTVADRYTALGGRTRQVIAAAALLGQRFEWQLLGRITELDDDTVLASLREAVYAQLIVDDGDALRFRHALTRRHITAALLTPERTRLAGRALRVVVAAHPGVPGPWCDLAAELAEHAGDIDTAIGHLATAAARARDRGALSTAAARVERALTLAAADDDRRGELHLLLAEVRAAAGDVDGALAAARATDEATAATAAPERLHVDLAVGRALLDAGRTPEAQGHAERAHRVATERGDRRAEQRARLLAADAAIAAQDLEVARELAGRVLAEPDLDADLRCEALELLGRCTRVHDVAEAARLFSRELDLARDADLVLWQARALHELGTIDLLDVMRTDRLEQARRAAIEAGAPALAAVADLHLAAALIARGRPAAGREAAERAEALAGRLGHAVAPWATMLVARSLAHEGDVAASEAAIARALAASDDPALASQAVGHVRAMRALHQGDPSAALVALDRAAALLRQVPGHHDPHRGLWALLRTLAEADDEVARREAASAAGSDTRYNRSMLAVAAAVVAGREGDVAAAGVGYDRGIEDLSGYEEPDLLVHLTGWLVAPAASAHGWGDPIGWLQQAVRWFADHGHEPLATSCRTLLRDAGAPVPRQGRGASTVPADLLQRGVTSREVDVLHLVGERLSNADIAARLVLSPRTVEKHVAALLRKTGSPDRAALASLAATLDEVAPA